MAGSECSGARYEWVLAPNLTTEERENPRAPVPLWEVTGLCGCQLQQTRVHLDKFRTTACTSWCALNSESPGCKSSKSRQELECWYEGHGGTCTQLLHYWDPLNQSLTPGSRVSSFFPPLCLINKVAAWITFLKGGHPSPWASLGSVQGKEPLKSDLFDI